LVASEGEYLFYGVSWGKQRRKAACLQVVARSQPFVRNIFSSDKANKCICTKSCLAKKQPQTKNNSFLYHFIIKNTLNLFIIDKNI
jgi:hypothetical protein